MTAIPETSRTVRLISFNVGGELFLLDIMSVRQIVPYTGSTPVPKAPSFIEGIMVLRNEVIPIIDLHERLFPLLPPAEMPFVFVTSSDQGTIGLKVDQVRRILNVDLSSILPTPPIISGLDGQLFIGVVEQNKTVYLLLDLAAILSPDERRSLDEADLTPEN